MYGVVAMSPAGHLKAGGLVALASAGPVMVAAARVTLNAITAWTCRAAFAVNAAEAVRQG